MPKRESLFDAKVREARRDFKRGAADGHHPPPDGPHGNCEVIEDESPSYWLGHTLAQRHDLRKEK